MATPDMKKPSLAIIIADRLAKKKSGSAMHDSPMVDEDMAEPSEEGDSEEMEKSAVQDLLDALSSKDVDAAHAALSDFVDLHLQKGEPAEDE